MMKRSHISGFSLLEMLLVIGLFASFMMGLIGIFDGWSQRALNRKTAVQILQLQAAAVQYVESNYASFTSDTVNVFYQIPISDLANGIYLPTGYDSRNPFRQQTRVYRRKLEIPQMDSSGAHSVDIHGTLIWKTVFEVLTITDNPAATDTRHIPNNFLMDIVQAGGTKMGIYSEMGAGASRISSPLNEWSLAYTSAMLPGYTGVPNPTGGYLAAYEVVSSTSLKENDNYLYRVEIPGRPELNQMRADLYMDGQNIRNVGTLTADKVDVSGNAAFLGNGEGAGDVLAMTIDQALRVNGTGINRIAMKASGAGCSISNGGADPTTRRVDGAGCVVTGGEMQVISAETADLYVTNGLKADGSIITDNAKVLGTTVARGTSTFDTVTGSTLRAYDEIIAPNVNVTGTSLTTQQLQAGNVNVGSGGFSSSGGLTAARVSPTGGLGVYTQRLDLDNVADVGTFVTYAVNVTNALDFVNVEATAASPMTYNDLNWPLWASAVSMTQVCTLKSANNKTYCEPQGSYLFSENGNTYRRVCRVNPGEDGYWCEDWRAPAPTYVNLSIRAQCFFRRDNSASGVARHENPVCTFS